MSKVQKLTSERKRHLKARLHEADRDQSWWEQYFSRIAASQFCRGGPDGAGWRATFDWAIRGEDVVAKVLEGQYDDRTPSAAPENTARKTRNPWDGKFTPKELGLV